MEAMFEWIAKMVTSLQNIATRRIPSNMDEAFAAARLLAESAGEIARNLVDALALLEGVAKYVGPTEDQLKKFMRDLQYLMERLIRWISFVIAPMIGKISKEMMQAFEAMVAAIGEAVETLTALVDYVTPGQDAIDAFTADYQRLFDAWLDWAAPSNTFSTQSHQIPDKIAVVFADVMSGLGDAVETLTALVGYVSPGQDAIDAFTADYQRLFDAWLEWAAPGNTLSTTGHQIPDKLAALFADVMSGLGDAVETLTALVNYVTPSEVAIDTFTGDYQQMFDAFYDWASTSFTDVSLDVVTATGEAVGAVFDGLGAAADTLQAITWYVGPTSNSIDRFMDDMEQVMIRLRDWALGAFTTESMAFLQAFGEMAGEIFGSLGSALSLMSDIADYTVSGSEFTMALQRFNDNLYTMITSWRIWIVTIMEPETMAMVAEFATVLGGIVQGFRDALELLMDIDQANLPTADELEAFLHSVSLLFESVLTDFLIVAQGVTVAAYNLYSAFNTMFQTLADELWVAGVNVARAFLAGLETGMQNPTAVNAILDTMNALALQLKDVLMAAWGIASPSKVAMRIGEQFVAGLAEGLEDLQGIPGMIEDAVGLSMTNNVRLEPAPQRAYLTVNFQGAYQAGMTSEEEARISRAMVMELRRQGVALVTR
jgi:hypothetical protein